jgi:uncharacterized protein YbjT (DUF2867 family)
MANIGIIGGHGKVARLATPLLVERGNRVVSIIRKQEQAAEIEGLGAEPLVRDVMDLSREEMTELFREAGLDAVVWSAGVGGGDPERTWKVDRDAAIRSMDAAEAAGATRYVMVSYMGASLNHSVPEEDGFYAYAQSKAEADEHLRGSNLEWTLLGPNSLSEEDPSGEIRVTAEPGESTASRANVARVIDAVLADASTIRKAIPFTDGQTPIAEAIGSVPAADRLDHAV